MIGKSFFRFGLILLVTCILLSCQDKDKDPGDDMGGNNPEPSPLFADTLRFSTYNSSMFRNGKGQLVNELSNPINVQVQRVAAVIQHVRPDVLSLQEFDYDADGEALRLFQENYLQKSQNGEDTIQYRYAYVVPSNTGLLADRDLDGNGQVSLPNDAYGFGNFEGQYAFALLSRYPIDEAGIRSFQEFLWKDMPDAQLPEKADGSSYYSQDALDVFRLSSKNHIDIPVLLPGGERIHVLLSHPTPPVFDGPEDRNGLRNHDEIKLWADYISDAAYLIDDQGTTGGLDSGSRFVIMGDMNADPYDGDSADKAIQQLLNHNQVNQDVTFGDFIPASEGGKEANNSPSHTGDPDYDTSFFGLRVDYVLPSNNLEVISSGVFWPKKSDPNHILVEDGAASDHLLTWVDVKLKR